MPDLNMFVRFPCYFETFSAKRNSRPYKTYTEVALQNACQEIKEQKMTIYRASKTFGVPISTLKLRTSGNVLAKPGRPTVFDEATEGKIEEWILEMAEVGMPIKKNFLIKSVLILANTYGVQDRLKTGNFHLNF
jgi:hypothetical protein